MRVAYGRLAGLLTLLTALVAVGMIHAGSEQTGGGQGKEQPQAGKQEVPKGGIRVTAKVDGHTIAVQGNPQKYPFRYSGSSVLTAEQRAWLAKEGDIPEAVSKALLGCLLWPGEGDALEAAKLKSDGKKLTGEARVLHKYGKQGTHTLQVKLEGSVEEGRLSLKAADVTVAGIWDYGGGTVKLTGKAQITLETAP